jgi:hypothetical protein
MNRDGRIIEPRDDIRYLPSRAIPSRASRRAAKLRAEVF